jgi:cyclopropane fatty-acyl-phospholipid synthase-like methyltransferase
MTLPYNPIQAFDDFSATYLDSRINEFNNLPQLDLLAKQLDPLSEKNILELGCGGGVPVLKYFYDKGAKVCGVDFSEKMLSQAKTLLPLGHFIQEDMCHVALPNRYYDAVISFYAIFVLKLEQQYQVFEKIYQSLKLGGIAYFTLLSEVATKQKEFDGYLTFMNQTFYYAHTTPLQYIAKLEQIGFVDIHLEEKQIGSESCLWVYAKK